MDKHLPVKYDLGSFKEGKAACKKALQQELGLPVNADIPLVAFIGRLDYQKGADIVLQVRVARSRQRERENPCSNSRWLQCTGVIVLLCCPCSACLCGVCFAA